MFFTCSSTLILSFKHTFKCASFPWYRYSIYFAFPCLLSHCKDSSKSSSFCFRGGSVFLLFLEPGRCSASRGQWFLLPSLHRVQSCSCINPLAVISRSSTSFTSLLEYLFFVPSKLMCSAFNGSLSLSILSTCSAIVAFHLAEIHRYSPPRSFHKFYHCLLSHEGFRATKNEVVRFR